MNPITGRPEPLISTAFVTAVVAALLMLLSEFGIPLSEGQTTAINAFIVVVAPLAVAGISRQWLTPSVDPVDRDGEQLVRADGAPLISEKELREVKEAEKKEKELPL